MRFLVDAQLPPALAAWLRRKGHEAQTVKDIDLRDADDTSIWSFAAATGAIIVTKDEDFALLATTADTPSVLGSDRAIWSIGCY
jgi:predicted nuclease of predicted toxin-antitoxin system